MNRVELIQALIEELMEELNNIVNTEELQDLSAEDCLMLAAEVTVNQQRAEKTQLMANINREDVEFVIDEDFCIPLYKKEEYDED